MKLAKNCRLFIGLLAILGLLPDPARAGGFDLPDQDAFAIARGMAFVATADNPSAIYYNPAGISQGQGQNLRLGLYGLYLGTTYKSGDKSFDTKGNYHALPQLYYTYNPQSLPLSFGLGAYAPFGLSTTWPQNTGFRTVAYQGELDSYAINPVVSWRILTNLSFGAGLVVNYTDIDLRQGLSPLPENDLLRLKGDGWGVSYNLGVLYQPIPQISLGASFRGPTTININGHTETDFNGVLPTTDRSSSADLPLPLKVICGISYRPTPDWNFEFDADYTDWNTFSTVNVNQSSGIPALGIPKQLPLVFGWQSSWYYELGATRYLGKQWSVSAGYIYNQNSSPNAHFNPVIPDMDRQFISAGAGYKVGRFDLDLAYQFGFGPARFVTGDGAADGRYSFMTQAIALSVTTHF